MHKANKSPARPAGATAETNFRGIELRPIHLLTGFLLLLFVAWRVLPNPPYGDSFASDCLGTPLGLLAVFAAARTSWRSRTSPTIRRAWLWIALALAGQAGGDLYELTAEAIGAGLPYPSVADLLYLTFYPLMLVGILGFPSARPLGGRSREVLLDGAIVGVGVSSAFVYLVLGPHALAGASPAEAVVTIAYPTGDMVLIVALAAAVLGNPVPAVRRALRWISVAISMFVLGDVLFGYVVLHTTYDGRSLINISYQVAFACFIVAAVRAPDESAGRLAPTPSRGAGRAWLTYAAVIAALAAVVRADFGEPFFPGVAATVMAAGVVVLVLVRQLLFLIALNQSKSHLAEAQRLSQIGSWEWDVNLDRVRFSDEGARLLGLDAGGTADLAQVVALVDPDDRVRFERVVQAALDEQRPYELEIRFRLHGEDRTFLCRGMIAAKNGATVRLYGTHQDVTDRKRMEARLEYQAVRDPLTGLFNRRQFADELERALRLAHRHGRAGAVLMIDIDDFKLVNDTHGHAVGDQTLKTVAATVTRRTRDTDFVARLGGDEFVVVLPEAAIEDARKVAEDIRGAFGETNSPSLSIGLAQFDGSSELLADDLLAAADIALYEAKHAGKNQVVTYSGEPRRAMHWIGRIRNALEEDKFILYGQPIVDLKGDRISHKELLIRMVGDDGEIILPGAFLPTAERVGLITEIDRWVTRNGLVLVKRGEWVTINLAGPSIGDPQILDMVADALTDGVDPAQLIFEITETAAMTNFEAARAFVCTLSGFGCGVALDDFGTGFGSFTYLKHLPTSHLKIDSEFVRDVLVNSTDREVVKSISQVAHSLGKRTVAEGVEDQETLDAMRAYGVDYAQGWFTGPPEPILTTASESFGRSGAQS